MTNVLRYSSVRFTTVVLEHPPGELTVSFTDDVTGADGPNPAGHGLVGMRERVALLGGELAAGPLPTGGFRVRASIPCAS